MDMSKLSDSDLRAIASGDLRMMSADGLRMLASTKEPAAPSPTEGMSGPQKFFAGVGKGMTDLARGAGQLMGVVSQQEIDEAKRLDAPLMETGAGIAGNIAGLLAGTLPAALIPGANTTLGAGLVGGGIGALNPTATGESRAANVALGAAGGAIGQKIGQGIGKVIAGRNAPHASGQSSAQATAHGGDAGADAIVSGGATARGTGGGYNFGTVGDDPAAGLTVAQQEAMRRGQELGFRLTPGQASGSRALQQLEAKLESQPMTSGPFNAIKDQNQRALNRAAAKAIGEVDDVVDSTVLARANERISSVYKLVADDTPRPIDPDGFLARLSGVESEFEGLLPQALAENPLVSRLFRYAESGSATGRQLQDLASKLGKAANSQMTSASGDRQLGMALFQVKDMADDLLASGLSGETRQLFDAARGQYRNLMLLTQRAGVVNPSSGNVQGNALAGLLQQKDKGGFLYGRNSSDMYDAARFAQAFRPIVGDSGTATRAPLPSPTDFVLSLPFNLATRAYVSSPVVSASAGAANALNRGVMPGGPAGQIIGPRMGYAGLLGGGLLGQAQ